MPKKNTAQLRLFEETLYEYLILLSPSDPIKEEVDRLKQLLNEQIGLEPYNLNSIAHVSLFTTEAAEDSSVVKLVKKIASAQPPFNVVLAGHEVLKHGNVSRTLCLKIEDPEPINNIMSLLAPPKESKRAFRQTTILDKPQRAKKIIHPHITIARRIPLQDFTRITDLSAFDYHDEWLCDRITILRRPTGSIGRFSPCKVIPLG